jgi:radical SAM family uncharacterized protein/radical SAM-linked protein
MSRLDQSTVEDLISRVQKPGRYMGCELNSIVKDRVLVRMALSYPDLYEVGMCNNGLRILYDIANSLPDVACERVFAVEADFESVLRESGMPLYTLETYTPLNELDIIGFNVSHELLCTNLLQVLDLGRIPLRRVERRGSEPIVIAGGEAVSNPFPLSDFIDLFFIGDGEEGIVEIADAARRGKEQSLGRNEIIEVMAGIDGVLVPSLYPAVHSGTGAAETPARAVRKRIYRGRTLMDPIRPVVPNIRIAQERIVIEVTRGCGNFCNFCHAGYYDLPYRRYDHGAIAGRIFEIARNTGYNEVTLSSLSISDYPHLVDLINAILPGLTERGISVSFPSLRVDAATIPLIEQISEVRRASLTFAVESASDEIRALANKDIIINDLIDIVRYVFQHGWKVIKLYFMIGLPGCEHHDEAGDIVRFMKEIFKIGGRGLDINVTVSPFVPKPHTPFERMSQMNIEYFEKSVRSIKQNLPRAVKIKNHNIRASVLEGVIARGDDRLGGVILRSYIDGCRFDSWEEHFRYEIWQANLDRALPGWERFLDRRGDEAVPWSRVQTGFERFMRVQQEKDPGAARAGKREHARRSAIDVQEIDEARKRFSRRFAVTNRIRLRIAKRGMMRFIPHNDFLEIVKRGLRMADIPVAMSQGFNKRERISTGFPLPLGIESEAELVDVELFECVDGDVKQRLQPCFPGGIEVVDVRCIDQRISLMGITGIIGYKITFNRSGEYSLFCKRLDEAADFTKRSKNLERNIAFSAVVHSFTFTGGESLLLRLYTGTEESMRIDDAVRALSREGKGDMRGVRIVKTAQYQITDGACELIT